MDGGQETPSVGPPPSGKPDSLATPSVSIKPEGSPGSSLRKVRLLSN